MTIEIPEGVLTEVMLLTGKSTKRDAVEYALREAARRAKRTRIWSEGLDLSADQLAAEATPQPSDLLDAPEIDEDAVQRFLANAALRRQREERRKAPSQVNEPPGHTAMGRPLPEAQPDLILVDSSFYITLHRRNQDPLAELTRFAYDYDIAINGIVWAEVIRGRADPHVRRRNGDRASSRGARLRPAFPTHPGRGGRFGFAVKPDRPGCCLDRHACCA